MIITKLKKYWNDKGFETLLFGILFLIIFIGIFNKLSGKKGTWSNSYYYTDFDTNFLKLKNNYNQNNNYKKDSKGELECRRVLQNIFQRPFDKNRPDFLRNSVTGNKHNLELDCYNKQLRLAVEYNGRQHYDYIPYFHRNKEAFYNQKYRDEIKKRICKDLNITLIEVPYTVKHRNIQKYLINKLRFNGYKI